MRLSPALLFGAIAVLFAAQGASPASRPPGALGWYDGWASPPFPRLDKEIPKHVRAFENQTVRQVVRTDLAGRRLRLRLTDELGTTPVKIGGVHIALSDVEGVTRPGTDRVVTFSGRRDITLRAGAPLVSDVIDLPIQRFDEVAISIYYPDRVEPAAHNLQVSISQPGDFGAAQELPGATSSYAPALASQLEIETRAPRRVIVTFGDSITEGAGTKPKTHMSWPDQLADRLARDPRYRNWTVINEGISGNRVLWDGAGPNALARFDRDVLDIPGATDVVVLEGINDIGWGQRPDSLVSAEDLIAAYKQMILRAHARGLKIYAGTILPFEGAVYYTPEGEKDRETVNRWIRTSGAFDGVIDFEAVMKEPGDPLKLRLADQIGDHLHPNPDGYALMAGAIDPNIFEH